MPEIAEIARVVHFLTLHLVGRKIRKATAVEDVNVFGKVGTSASQFEAALTGKKVLSCGRQGKYFWLILDQSPHPVMHFGMTGWIHIKNQRTAYTNYYKKMKDDEMDMWPPKYWKFQLETEGDDPVEVAFTDPRRFGRIRLIDCPGEDIRRRSPLQENGPDPVVDTDLFTEDYLRDKMRSRHVPIKALILDQAMISGIGNWVGDEVLYHSRLHPEQYCDDFDDEQIHALYEAIRYVCTTAVDKLGDSDQFPEDWLFAYRWGKGSKGAAKELPNGEKLAFLTVGGRTSCYVPDRQKKSGRVAPGVKEVPVELESVQKQPKKKKSPKSKRQVAKTQAPESGQGDLGDERQLIDDKRKEEAEVKTPLNKKRKRKGTDEAGSVEVSSAARFPKLDDDATFGTPESAGWRQSNRLRNKKA